MDRNVNANRAQLCMWEMLAARTPEELEQARVAMERRGLTALDLAVYMAAFLNDYMRISTDDWDATVITKRDEFRAYEAAGILDPGPGAESTSYP